MPHSKVKTDPRDTGFRTFAEPPVAPAAEPSLPTVAGAAFRMENPEINAIEILTKPTFQDDPEFLIFDAFSKGPLKSLEDRKLLAGARSQAEFDFKTAKIQKQREDRRILTASGGTGLVLSMGAGAISFTSLVPLGVAGTFLKGAAKGATLTAVSVAAGEIPLAIAQETRTNEEIFTGIAAGAILGGIMGGAVGSMNKRAFRKAAYDMAVKTDDTPIPTTGVQGSSVFVDTITPVTERYKFRQADGQMIEFFPQKLLVVTQDSIALLAKQIKGKITQAKLEAYAKQNGFDSIHVDDFENLFDTPAKNFDGTPIKTLDEAGNEVDKLVAKVPEQLGKKDRPKTGLTVLDEKIIKKVSDDIPDAPYPDFGTGVGRIAQEFEAPGQIVGAGAQSAIAPSAGGLKKTLLGTQTAVQYLIKTSPVARTIDQIISPIAQRGMAQLSDAGLRLEKNILNIATSRGGTVENRVKEWYAPVVDAIEELNLNYANYLYDGKIPFGGTGIRGVIKGQLSNSKLSRQEFLDEITKAMRNGDKVEGGGPAATHIEATARVFREKVYNPMLEEAKKVGIFPAELEDIFDVSYVNRVYNKKAIKANEDGFIKLLADHYEQALNDQANRELATLAKRSTDLEFFISDTKLTPKEIETFKVKFEEELKKVTDDAPKELLDLEDEITYLRSQAKIAPDAQSKKDFSARAKELATNEKLKETKKTRAGLRKRLRNFNKNRFILEEKQLKKFDTIDKIEELSLSSLQRGVRQGQRLLSKLDRVSEERLGGEVTRIKNMFAATVSTFDRGEARLAKLSADEIGGDFGKIINAEILQENRMIKLDEILDALDAAEGKFVNREGLKQVLEDGLNVTLEKIVAINARRALRAERLAKQAEKLSPTRIADEIGLRKTKLAGQVEKLNEKLTARGADEVDIPAGRFNFRDAAIKAGRETTDIILKNPLRLSAVDVIQAKRGAELTRSLSIASKILSDAGFLEDNALDLMKTYVRTLSADIEITKKFGDANGAQLIDDIKLEKLANSERLRAEGGLDAQKLIDQSNAAFNQIIEDLDVVISRARHTRGIPDDAESAAFRIAKVASNASVLRYMGMVLPSSIPDISRPIQKHGLQNVIGNGLVPLLTNFKQFVASARELRLAGGALDVYLHTTALARFDVFDEIAGSTGFERALDYGTGKMGIIAMFDYWNVAMKKFTAVLDNAKLVDSIDLVTNGKGTRAELDEAIEFLASSGIDSTMISRMWEEITTAKGGSKINNIWLPNTEEWADKELVTAYRAALVGNVDNTIVTPGFERPNIVDKSIAHKLLFQFKSFALSSTTKTLIAGLQQRDANHIMGSIISVGFGVLSYYIWAMSIGGETQRKMENASWEELFEEGYNRSGIGGVTDIGRQIAGKVPLLTQPDSPVSPLLPTPFSSRSGGSGDLFTTLLGPSFDLGSTLSKVITGLNEPTASTVHKFRTLLPLQNHFALRRGFTQTEEATRKIFGIPDRRN